ncbi:MAG: hypothetical protein OXH52_09555 [Gammaproteobacteria bacterium]|nr:hypothetical protein [Gammaproteobacteria bacterium]
MAYDLPLLPDDLNSQDPLHVTTMGAYRGSDGTSAYLVWGDGDHRVVLRFPHKAILGAYAKMLLDQVEPSLQQQILDALHRIASTLDETRPPSG